MLRGRWTGLVAAAVILGAVGLVAGVEQRDVDTAPSALRPLIERYVTDRATLQRSWAESPVAGQGARGRGADVEPLSPDQAARMRRFYQEWTGALDQLDFDRLDQAGKIDALLLGNRLRYELSRLDLLERDLAEIQPLVSFGSTVVGLEKTRREMRPVEPEASAKSLTRMIADIAVTRGALTGDPRPGAGPPKTVARETALRAVAHAARLRNVLHDWCTFYNGYDPAFTWWVGQTCKDADKAIEDYASFLQGTFGGVRAGGLDVPVVNPIGRDALMVELAREMIPYTPEELIAIANTEFAWCDREMLKASRDLGFGDDWRAALEKVKTMHADPGQQPEVVRALVLEGIDFVKRHDLVTVPPLAEEIWRMQMMSPQRQLVSPFFLGGEVIMVSFPTDAMTFEQKMMSMRGNNIPFSHATAFHEMIPGHELQGFMTDRYRTYRAAFATPFWTEGNALWWEMLFWDLGYPRTPEERIGMLFWRMHRCARIIFSLSYHLGTMTPAQAVDFLVQRVGHERDNALGEVRRSFDGSYAPLYQCAYMLGALQFRALHAELVGSKKMTNRQFHDAILEENRIPVELVRADLTGQKLTRDYRTGWKFYGPVQPAAGAPRH